MRNLFLFLHLAAAIFWMGGMAFMILALRPALGTLEPPQRLPVLGGVLRRFFIVVDISVLVLLVTGVRLLLQVPAAGAPVGWHAMAALGIAMMLVFLFIRLVPWRRMRAALGQAQWPVAGQAAQQIALLAKVNLGLGWLAIAAVIFWR
ncbi:CopD family protein [Ramlibacter albus]|uniref:CopD family protein n=1 Tax=Ramlibacter albus TaxID=2079448 RepID=A0A923M3Y7_9BURK|nr:CopD family protein [Ramlibacter albus]MBC5763426.1 CopD family protein [Ramlibacter albus]